MEPDYSSTLEDRDDLDTGDVLWDLHDEQEQIEAYQHICSTAANFNLQKVLPFPLNLLFK